MIDNPKLRVDVQNPKKMETKNCTIRQIKLSHLTQIIEMKIPNLWTRTNVQITNQLLKHLKSNNSFTKYKASLRIEDYWFGLEGKLQWDYQRQTAELK